MYVHKESSQSTQNQNKMCSRIKSSFPGKIIEIPGIAVDNFETKNLRSRAFFLSHCHSDHTKGLFSFELRNALKCSKIFIYMSELSAAIVADDCSGDPTLMDNIKPLPIGTTHVTLPGLFDYEESSLRVTLVNAGHCLGSVMFLFHTINNKTILYTGDFNLSSNDITKYASFHNQHKEPIRIDVIYVDTTFLREKYNFFPKRSEVINDLSDILKEWLYADDKNRVAYSLSAKYGYEYIFKEIYEKLGVKVYVNDERWRFYRNHPSISEAVTNQECASKIHICRNYSESCYHKRCSLTKVEGFAYLFIRFSAMAWDEYQPGDKAIRRLSDKRTDVCFPTHCSRTELISFVSYFSPKKIVGFPQEWTYSHPRELSDSEVIRITPRKRKSETPKKSGKVDRNVDKNVLRQIFDI